MISAFKAIQYMQQGSLTAVELSYGSRTRIHDFDILLNALLQLNIDAAFDAKEADFIRQNSPKIVTTKPLLGIPLIVKDVFKTQLLPTSGGLELFEFHQTTKNAAIVEKFLHAGAYLLAKSNTPALALDVQTFNHIKSACNNPWDLSRTPGGSSGGSAVAVACGYAPLALGTDLNGSMRIPAAFTGVFSYKPTDGKYTTEGLFPPFKGSSKNFISLTVGVFANYIVDLELAYFIMEGQQKFNTYSVSTKSKLKIAFSTYFEVIETDSRIITKMQELASLLARSFELDYISPEFTQNEHKMTEIIHAQRIFANAFIHADTSPKNPIADSEFLPSDKDYKWALGIRKSTQDVITEILKEYDIWIVPATPILPFKHNPLHQPIFINGKEVNYWKAIVSYCTPFSVSGHPVITFPIGVIDGLPVGIQIIGNEDREVLQYAKLLEQVIPRMPINPILIEEL